MIRRRNLALTGIAFGALALAACGGGSGDAPTIDAGGPPSTEAEIVEVAPEVAQAAPCDAAVFEGAYIAEFGQPPAGATFAVDRCLEGYATASMYVGFEPPVFVVYRAVEGGGWEALGRGYVEVCADTGIPPEIAPQIGCDV
jgi:hypothetical protein